MGIVWNEQTLRWFLDASVCTGYDRALAALLRPLFPAGGTLCDLGCGAALTDFELSPDCRFVTCVDSSPEAVSFVRNEAARRHIPNLTARCMDAAEVPEQFDAVMTLFHGSPETFDIYFQKTRQVFLIVTRRERLGQFGPENRRISKRGDTASMHLFLDARGVRYSYQETELEHGQPLRTIEDAAAFVRAYAAPMPEAELLRYLDSALLKTGREDFPYYLPNRKKLGLFVIRRDENEGIL